MYIDYLICHQTSIVVPKIIKMVNAYLLNILVKNLVITINGSLTPSDPWHAEIISMVGPGSCITTSTWHCRKTFSRCDALRYGNPGCWTVVYLTVR